MENEIYILAEKLNGNLQERLGTNFYAGYINGKVIICHNYEVIATIWHGSLNHNLKYFIIQSLVFEELEIITSICNLQKV